MIFYLAFALLCLILHLAFPTLPLHGPALVLAYAFLGMGLLPSLLLAVLMSLAYGIYSVSPWWQMLLPWTLGLGLFHLLRGNFSFGRRFSLAVLVLFLFSFSLLAETGLVWWRFGKIFLERSDLIPWFFTEACALLFVPLLAWLMGGIFSGLWRKFFGGQKLESHLAWQERSDARKSRKPFGLEKGI